MRLINLLLVLTLIVGCSRKSSDKGTEIFPDMVHSVAAEAYSDSKVFKDGKVMQLPAKGSIARGFMPYPYKIDEYKKAGAELVNPYAETKETFNRGHEVYKNYCQVCHGVKGKGDGPLIPKFPNPPSFTSKRLRKYSKGRLFHIVTVGAGDMPSHQEQISYEDRWSLVQYVKWMQNEYRKK